MSSNYNRLELSSTSLDYDLHGALGKMPVKLGLK